MVRKRLSEMLLPKNRVVVRLESCERKEGRKEEEREEGKTERLESENSFPAVSPWPHSWGVLDWEVVLGPRGGA